VSTVGTYDLFGLQRISSAKVTLNNKEDATVLPFRFPNSDFQFNFVMETSLLLDFLFYINFNLALEINPFTLEGIQTLIPQFTIPSISLPPTEMLNKCYFGESTFDNCYYDPGFTIENVRNYLRSAINRISRNITTPNFLLNLNYPQWFSYYANRLLNAAMQAIEKNTILDLAIFDYSEFSPETPEGETYLPFQWLTTSPELNQTIETPHFDVVDDVLWGVVLDWTLLDLCIFIPEGESILGPQFAQLMDAIIAAIKMNYSALNSTNKLAFVDPSIPDIPIPPTLTSLFTEAFPNIMENAPFAPLTNRAENWGMAMMFMRTIRNIVKRIVGNSVGNPFMINAYEDAGVEYCMAFHHNHDRERYKAWANVDVQTFTNAWVSKWVNFGLDPQTLNTLANTLSPICQSQKPGFKGVDSPS